MKSNSLGIIRPTNAVIPIKKNVSISHSETQKNTPPPSFGKGRRIIWLVLACSLIVAGIATTWVFVSPMHNNNKNESQSTTDQIPEEEKNEESLDFSCDQAAACSSIIQDECFSISPCVQRRRRLFINDIYTTVKHQIQQVGDNRYDLSEWDTSLTAFWAHPNQFIAKTHFDMNKSISIITIVPNHFQNVA